MADTTVQPSIALKAMEREYKSKALEMTALYEKLTKHAEEKETELENMKYDLQDQTESRRHWHKRANDAETRAASVQHVLILVDGNQIFFNSDLIRSGGAKQAVEQLITEAKASARAQHKNDLPEHLSVIVHIFIDVGKLADDLSTANLLPEPDQLWTFIQDASKHEVGLTISDCGSGHQAVDLKMKHFYELYLENCHCRHLFLALGRESEYYKVLSTYADDDYTRMKTSLIEPTQGLPDNSLPFHTAKFSTLESVRRQTVAFSDTTSNVNGTSPRAESALKQVTLKMNGNPPTGLRAATNLNPNAPRFNGLPPAPSQAQPAVNGTVPRSNGASSATARSESTAMPAYSHGTPPITSPRLAFIDVKSRQDEVLHTTPTEQAPQSPRPAPASAASPSSPALAMSSIKPGPASASRNPEEVAELIRTFKSGEDSSSAGVVKLDTSSHSSQSTKAAEQGWETATTNSYVPAPISVPWGEEEPLPQQTPQFDGPSGFSKNHNNGFNRRQGRGNFGGGAQQDRGSRSGRRPPKQFDGSWDELVASERSSQSFSQGSSSSPSPRPATVSILSATPKSIDFNAKAFTRQVVTKPEPHPQARPVQAPIALNETKQRIDLKLPKPTHFDEEAFNLRTKNRHLCNEHHMRGCCSDTKCIFDHEEISDGMYLALRNKVRSTPCKQGSECRRHDCYFAHHCPNVSRASACGRPSCPFKIRGLHNVLDLDIVEMIELPKQELLVEGLI